MKNPQHDHNLLFLDGQVINWSPKAVKNLLKCANQAVINEDTNNRHDLSWKEFADIVAHDLLQMIIEKGITKEVLLYLNKRISHIEYRRALIPSDLGHPVWRDVAIGDSLNDPELKTTYIVSHLLAKGEFKNLKKCKLKDCRSFFIGPPNKTWCSSPCGSLHRVRAKRRKNNS